MDIVCLASNPNDFDNPAWKIGQEYDSKIVRDIEQGLKFWESLDRCIDPTGWAYAKEVIAKSNFKPNPANKPQGNGQNSGIKMCTTYNNFRRDGCQYEFNNPGQQCVFQHICGNCKAKGLVRKHKTWQCTVPENSPASGALANPTSHPPVTSV